MTNRHLPSTIDVEGAFFKLPTRKSLLRHGMTMFRGRESCIESKPHRVVHRISATAYCITII